MGTISPKAGQKAPCWKKKSPVGQWGELYARPGRGGSLVPRHKKNKKPRGRSLKKNPDLTLVEDKNPLKKSWQERSVFTLLPKKRGIEKTAGTLIGVLFAPKEG